MSCTLVNVKYVLPGWGCCRCHVYNSMQRTACQSCGHEPCLKIPAVTIPGPRAGTTETLRDMTVQEIQARQAANLAARQPDAS